MEEILSNVSPYILSIIIAIIMPILVKNFSLKDIVSKIDSLLNDGTVTELKEQVEVLNNEVTELKRQVAELKERIVQLNDKINEIDNREVK